MYLVENNCCPAHMDMDHEASCAEMKLIGLPNEVLLLFFSFLTTKEVARTSLVSKTWRRWLLGYYPKLNFEDSRTRMRLRLGSQIIKEELPKEMSIFVNRVDSAVKQHLDSSIDEFTVTFDLDETVQSHVDNWVAFAFTKRVKNLELHFTPFFGREDEELHRCRLTPEQCKPLGVNHALTSLSLKYVNITSEAVESILLSCPFLENLCIEESDLLTRIKSPASSLSLKRLDVSRCNKLQAINISAPKLLFLSYSVSPIELNIENASSLSSVSFNGVIIRETRVFAFESLSTYLPQLEVLSLRIFSLSTSEDGLGDEHLPLPDLPQLTKLKVLKLIVVSSHTRSLLGWTPLIDACPILEKLTLQLNCCYDNGYNWDIAQRNGLPLNRLKTLELLSYRGRLADIEFATFIFKNAVMLQEVIVEVRTELYDTDKYDPVRISELKENVPQGANFTLRELSEDSFKLPTI